MSGRTRFRAEGSAVYMVTPSGKQLCVTAQTDWLSPECIAGMLQTANDLKSAGRGTVDQAAVRAAAAELVRIRYGPQAEALPRDVDLARRILLAAGVAEAVEPVPASETGEEGP